MAAWHGEVIRGFTKRPGLDIKHGVYEAVQGARWAPHQKPELMDSCSREKMERVGAAMNQPLLRRRNHQIQPGRVVGSLISGSNGSNPTNKWKYRTKAMTSEVDESLFGVKQTPKDESIIVQKNENARCKALSAGTRGHKPETIRINTSDLIRGLIAPSEDPSGLSLIPTSKDSQHLKSAARVRTKPEREMATQAVREEKEAMIDALKEKRKQEEIISALCQKERELARREMETIAKQKQSRLEQVAHKEHLLAVQAERERVLRAQRGEQEEKTRLRMKHRAELLGQVREDQQKQHRNPLYLGGSRALVEEARERRARLDELKLKKLEELRAQRGEQEEKKRLQMKHRAELLRQVREDQQKQHRNPVSLGGSRALVEEARERRARLDELKLKKLEELRKAGVPDEYCSMVAR